MRITIKIQLHYYEGEINERHVDAVYTHPKDLQAVGDIARLCSKITRND